MSPPPPISVLPTPKKYHFESATPHHPPIHCLSTSSLKYQASYPAPSISQHCPLQYPPDRLCLRVCPHRSWAGTASHQPRSWGYRCTTRPVECRPSPLVYAGRSPTMWTSGMFGSSAAYTLCRFLERQSASSLGFRLEMLVFFLLLLKCEA